MLHISAMYFFALSAPTHGECKRKLCSKMLEKIKPRSASAKGLRLQLWKSSTKHIGIGVSALMLWAPVYKNLRPFVAKIDLQTKTCKKYLSKLALKNDPYLNLAIT